MEWRKALDILVECEKSDRWPGYPTTLEPLGLPGWAKKNLEN